MAARTTLHGRTFDPYLSPARIDARIDELAAALAATHGPGRAPATARAAEGVGAAAPLFLGVLQGAAVFHADLIRACDFPLAVGYLRTRSYAGMASTGAVAIDVPDDLDVRGRDVVVVEDIVDSGRTLRALRDLLTECGAARVTLVVLLDKPDARVVEVPVEHVGFAIDDAFVVGYGLDYDGLGRNLPGVYRLAA